jgi:hypothetical protein
MMSFYADMQAMVSDLLAPDALGQGSITIARLTAGPSLPDQPWLSVEPMREEWTVNQIGMTKAEYVNGGTVIKTDLAYMTEPPAAQTRPGDVVEHDGVQVGTVVHVAPFPTHGDPVFQKIYVNR